MTTNEKKLPVITISREYAALGRSYAKILSEILSIEWYDKDLIRKASLESGYTEEDIAEEGEELSSYSKWIDRLNSSSMLSSRDRIFEVQKEMILKLSEKPCIIIGRCANIILKEKGVKTFDIFLYSDMANKIKRAEELSEYGRMDIKRFVEKRDRMRAAFYKEYTGHTFGDYHDYDLSFNTGIGNVYENCQSIAEIIRKS